MKMYSHAWIAFMSIERLSTVHIAQAHQAVAIDLTDWFKKHRDRVIDGAWYPDTLITRNSTDHVRKFTPDPTGESHFRNLPSRNRMYLDGQKSPLYERPYTVNRKTNLPNRCEALAHSIIDQKKVQQKEIKGSPVSPTNNQLALLMFMLAHYVADGHMPLHCDSRRFSQGANIHSHIEKKWEDDIQRYYSVDRRNECFFYDRDGFPERTDAADYQNTFLPDLDQELQNKPFYFTYGQSNANILEFMDAVCQYSYLTSYMFIPPGYDESNVTTQNYHNLPGRMITLKQLSVNVFSDAIDSLARVWLRVWRRYKIWEANYSDQSGTP